MGGMGSECSMVSNPLHCITDGAAGSPAAVTLKDRSTKFVDMHGGGDDPGPRPDTIRIVQMFRLHAETSGRILCAPRRSGAVNIIESPGEPRGSIK